MIRSLTLMLALVLSASGCNAPTCGPGTKQVQNQSTGGVECVPADQQAAAIPCTDDADAGTAIVAGKCVSLIQCPPGVPTMMEPDGTITCLGGSGKPMCRQPAAGTVCVQGTIHDFLDNSTASTSTLHVSLYDPQAFLLGGATPLKNADAMVTDGTFVFQDVPPPTTNLIALAVTDGSGTLVLGGTGTTVAPGKSFQLDGYVVKKSTVDGWQTTVGAPGTSGIDYSAGAYVGCFYSDPSRAMQGDSSAYETNPVSGVVFAGVTPGGQLIVDAAHNRYLDPTRDMINTSLTATGPLGCAVYPVASLSNFSGQPAGTVTKWEVHPGGSTQGVVFVDRFHPSM